MTTDQTPPSTFLALNNMPTNQNPQSAFSILMYNRRAPGYDAGNGGWHVDLGLDFIKWVQPKPGDAILDLACGTGLVTIPAAAATGESGVVIGVDISDGMLAEARKKPVNTGSAKIEWIEHTITDLSDLKQVQDVINDRGGFDIITCCSALVLLPDPAQTIKHWAGLLKADGKMIIDVPTEDKTLQHLLTVDVRHAVGTPLPYERDWIGDIHSLEEIYTQAGLKIDRSFRTRSYLPEKWYGKDECVAVFDAHMKMYPGFERDGTVEQAREAFKPLWRQNLRENGKFWDGHALYVTIGRKHT